MPPFEHGRILVTAEDTLRRALEVIDASAIQIALVVDQDGRLLGTVTDGDLRRGILRGIDLGQPVRLVMNSRPISVQIGTSREELLSLMTSRSIKQVPLVDKHGRVVGLEFLDNLLGSPALKENPVIIMAGGQGMRLRPLTVRTPKPLLKVGEQPVLELILRQLRAYGFHRFYISINYLGGHIEEYFGQGQQYGVSIQYLRETEPLGTAGPLSLVPGPHELPCVVINGDLLTRVNVEHMLLFHSQGHFDITLGVKEYPLQLPFGVVTTQGDRVVTFQEKPVETRLINAGVYIIGPDILASMPRETYYDMHQLIESALCQPDLRIGAFPIHEYWMDIGTPSDYQQAQRDYPSYFNQ